MYQTILLAAALQRWERYSTHALAARDAAMALAQGTSKRLHVLSVYDYEVPVTTDFPAEMLTKVREDYIRQAENLMVQKLDDYVAPLLAAGIDVAKILRAGNPRETIVQVATNIKADLLILGSHSKRGVLDIALGNTAQQVSRRAPCPVVLVSPQT